MATWGEGNFDNDWALDFLAEVVLKLLKEVQLCLKPENQGLHCGEGRLMPAIDILVTLGRAYPYMVSASLGEQPISELKEAYLRIFEERSDMNNEHEVQRRDIIAETFSNLEDIQKNGQKDGL